MLPLTYNLEIIKVAFSSNVWLKTLCLTSFCCLNSSSIPQSYSGIQRRDTFKSIPNVSMYHNPYLKRMQKQKGQKEEILSPS